MAQNIYITAMGPSSGKSVVALGFTAEEARGIAFDGECGRGSVLQRRDYGDGRRRGGVNGGFHRGGNIFRPPGNGHFAG